MGLCWGNPREREHLEDLSVDGRIMCLEIVWEDVGWVDVSQD
jgi:hypothetical protein